MLDALPLDPIRQILRPEADQASNADVGQSAGAH